MRPSLYHRSKSLSWVQVNTVSPSIYPLAFQYFCNRKGKYLPATTTTTPTPPSRSGDPPWILKWAGLVSFGRKLISSIGKIKRIIFFFRNFFFFKMFRFKKRCFFFFVFFFVFFWHCQNFFLWICLWSLVFLGDFLNFFHLGGQGAEGAGPDQHGH